MEVVSALYGGLQQESARMAAQAPYLMAGCKLAAAACEFMQKLQMCNAVHYVTDLVRPIFSIWDLVRYSNNMGIISTLLRAEHDIPVMADLVRSINVVLDWAKADGLNASDMQDKLQEGCRQFVDNFPPVSIEQLLLVESLHRACTTGEWEDEEGKERSRQRITEALNQLLASLRHPEPLTFADIWSEVAQIEKAAKEEQARKRNRSLVRMDKHLMLLRSPASSINAAAAVANVDRMTSGALSSKSSSGNLHMSGDLSTAILLASPPGSLTLASPQRPTLGRPALAATRMGRGGSGETGRSRELGGADFELDRNLRAGSSALLSCDDVSGDVDHSDGEEQDVDDYEDAIGDDDMDGGGNDLQGPGRKDEPLESPPRFASPFYVPLAESVGPLDPSDPRTMPINIAAEPAGIEVNSAAARPLSSDIHSPDSVTGQCERGHQEPHGHHVAPLGERFESAFSADPDFQGITPRADSFDWTSANSGTFVSGELSPGGHANSAQSGHTIDDAGWSPTKSTTRTGGGNDYGSGTGTDADGGTEADTERGTESGARGGTGSGAGGHLDGGTERGAAVGTGRGTGGGAEGATGSGTGSGTGSEAKEPLVTNPFLEYSLTQGGGMMINAPNIQLKPFLSSLHVGEADRGVTVRLPSRQMSSLLVPPTAAPTRGLDRSRSNSLSRASTLSLTRSLSSHGGRALIRAASESVRGGSAAPPLDYSITPDGHLVSRSDQFLAKMEEPLNDFLCPLTRVVMQDPVMLETGHTYDRAAIESWLTQGYRTCPNTGRLLRRMDLTTNHALKKIIDAWSQQQPQKVPSTPHPQGGALIGASLHSPVTVRRTPSKVLGAMLPSQQSSNDLFPRDFSISREWHAPLGPSSTLTPALLEAAAQGDAERVAQLLAEGAPVDGADTEGLTPLHHACTSDSVEAVRVLLLAGANIAARASTGATPLLTAAAYGRHEAVELLLSHSASMYESDSRHNTPLHVAALKGHRGVVEVLLKHEAPTECKDDSGASPLVLAARGGHVEVVDALIAASALINTLDKAGYPPLYYAVFEGHVKAAERLLQAGSAVNRPIGQNRNCLLLAPAIRGDAQMVKLLLRHGAKAYANRASLTPLYCAASNGHEDVVAALLDAPGGKDWVDVFESRSHMKLTPLLAAVRGGHNEVAYLLLRAGANMEYRLAGDAAGHTALMLAAAAGNAQAVKLLLKAGADVDAVDKDKRDALLLALEGRHIRVVEVLLDAGVSPNVKPHRSMSPLEMAALAGDLSAAQRLLAAGADVNAVSSSGSRPIQAACQQGNVQMVNWLVQHGANTGMEDEHGYLPLHDAVYGNSTATVQLLLDHGSDINAFTRDGDTPLIIAATQPEGSDLTGFLLQAGAKIDLPARGGGHEAVHAAAAENCIATLDLLLRQNADPNARDAHGSTPLHFAASWGHMEAVQLLMARGADMDAEDERHWSALDLALDKGHDEAALLLTDRGARINREDWSSLEFAVKLNRLRVVEFLLSKDPRQGAVSGPACPPHPLHLAAENELHEMAELLVKYGANVEARDEKGLTPLLAAAKEGSGQVVRVLLSVGADPTAVDPDGCTALHLAASPPGAGGGVVSSLLTVCPALAGMANKQQQLAIHRAAETGQADILKAMLKFESMAPHLNALAPLGALQCSPLAYACHYGQEAAARVLLAENADVGGSGGALPMVVAVGRGHAGVVQLLQRNMRLTKSYIQRHQQITPVGISGASLDDSEESGELILGSDSRILNAIDEELERELG